MAGDAWVCGVNSWIKSGYSIGTGVLNSCLNIDNSGNVEMPYGINTLGDLNVDGTIHGNVSATYVNVDEIRARLESVITIQENVVINGSLVITGSINGNNSNPFYIAGKVAANGTVLNSIKGRVGFSCSRSSTGSYVITPDTAFGNTNYIVNLTCQVDTDTGYVRLNSSILSASSFAVATSVGTVRTDCIFHLTVIN